MKTTEFIDKDWLRRAYVNARDLSDDPSTRNGSVLVPAKSNLVVYGANRLPREVDKKPERLQRPKHWIEHAERDAINRAAFLGYPTEGATLYVPWFACIDCARAIIIAGIRRVVGHRLVMARTPQRWMDTIREADAMLDEAGVIRDYVNEPLFDEDPAYQVVFNGKYWIP